MIASMDAEEIKCPVCLETLTDSLRLPCGHIFCQSCIQEVWDINDDKTSRKRLLFCPECQIFLPSDFEFNILLGLQRKTQDAVEKGSSMEGASSFIMCDQCLEKTEVAVKSCLNCDASLCSSHTLLHQQKDALRGHSLIEVTENLVSFKCSEHGEELKMFCSDHQVAVCCLCVVVGPHKNHRAVTLHEACSDFKKLLETNTSLLRQRRRSAESTMTDLEPVLSEVSKNAEACRLEIVEKYSQIIALIEADQKLMLSVLETEEFYTNKWLEWRLESLERQVREINAEIQLSQSVLQEENDIVFLKQLQRYKLGPKAEVAHLPSAEQECSITDKTKTVERLVDELHKMVLQNTQRLWSCLRGLSLDTSTAHPELEISADRLGVHWRKKLVTEREKESVLSSQYSVQAMESFSSDSHYWEVAVWMKPYWLIGLASESQDSAHSNTDFSNVFCYIYHGNGKYLVSHHSKENELAIGKTIQKLGVWVNIPQGAVSFYDGDTLSVLYSFFTELPLPVHPVFNPCMDINGRNQQPLALVHLKNKNLSQNT